MKELTQTFVVLYFVKQRDTIALEFLGQLFEVLHAIVDHELLIRLTEIFCGCGHGTPDGDACLGTVILVDPFKQMTVGIVLDT